MGLTAEADAEQLGKSWMNMVFNGIQYKYLSFSDSIMNLRKFLKYRDEEPMFDEIKAAGRVGLPLFQLEDGTLTFSLEEVIENTEK